MSDNYRRSNNGMKEVAGVTSNNIPHGEPQGKIRSKQNLIIALASTLAVLLVAGFVVFNNVAVASRTSDIPSAIPERADTVVVTDSSKMWWDKVARMAPMGFGLTEINPYEADLKIRSLGYARAADLEKRDISYTGPLRTFYLDAGTEKAAKKIDKWLSKKLVSHNVRVHRNENIVSVNDGWIKNFNLPEEPVSSRSDFVMNLSKGSSMWINFGNMIDSFSVNKDITRENALGTYFEKGFGFESGTAWVGTSSDGKVWAGEYTSGGFNPELRDTKKVEKVLSETERVVLSGKNKGNNALTSHALIDPQMRGLILDSGFRAGENALFGTVDPEMFEFHHVADEDMAVALNFGRWIASASGLMSFTEGVEMMLFSLNEDVMSITFKYTK